MRILALGVSLGAALLLAACGGAPAPEDAPKSEAAPVRTAPAESVRITDAVRAVGVLAPRDELRLSFKVGGVIETMAVEAGDRVRAGQTLAVLKRAEVDAAVAQATEGAAKARRDLERARQLRADEVATQEQVEDLTTAYNVARANLQAARTGARLDHQRLDRARRPRRPRCGTSQSRRRGDHLLRRLPGPAVRGTRDADRFECRSVHGHLPRRSSPSTPSRAGSSRDA